MKKRLHAHTHTQTQKQRTGRMKKMRENNRRYQNKLYVFVIKTNSSVCETITSRLYFRFHFFPPCRDFCYASVCTLAFMCEWTTWILCSNRWRDDAGELRSQHRLVYKSLAVKMKSRPQSRLHLFRRNMYGWKIQTL